MDQRQLGGEPPVGQVGEERLELAGGEHALVDHGPGRQRREVDVRPRARRACAGRRPAAPCRCPTSAPGGGGRRTAGGRPACSRGRPARRSSAHTGTSRQPRTLRPSSAARDSIVATAAARVLLAGRQEGDARGVRAAGGEREVDDLAQERVGDLGQDARAVTHERVGAGGAPVLQVAQGGQGVVDDVVPGAAAHRGDERDTAGVVLVLGAVEPLVCWLCGEESGSHGAAPSLISRETHLGNRGGQHWPAWSEQNSACPGSPARWDAEVQLTETPGAAVSSADSCPTSPGNARRPARQKP